MRCLTPQPLAGVRAITFALSVTFCSAALPAATPAAVPVGARAAGESAAADREFRAALARAPDLGQGRELFATCAACHSSDGSGIDDGSVPAIAGQYAPVIVKELTDFRNDRRWDIRMEHFVDRHHLQGPQQIADLAGFVAGLPWRPSPSHGDGTALESGTGAYFQQCAACHGVLGRGAADRLVPRLAGQNYAYLVREIHDTGDERRPNMAPGHVVLLGRLSVEEINGISDYLSRLSP
jgi:cytochrome c553